MDGEILALIRSGMSNIKAPASYDKVFKDEAMLNFDTPFTDGGLYVNMATWYGFGEDHLMEDAKRTGNNLYLHCSAIRVRKQTAEEEIEKVDKLAIGVSGGFLTDEQKYDVIKSYQLCVLDLSEGGTKKMIHVQKL